MAIWAVLKNANTYSLLQPFALCMSIFKMFIMPSSCATTRAEPRDKLTARVQVECCGMASQCSFVQCRHAMQVRSILTLSAVFCIPITFACALQACKCIRKDMCIEAFLMEQAAGKILCSTHKRVLSMHFTVLKRFSSSIQGFTFTVS